MLVIEIVDDNHSSSSVYEPIFDVQLFINNGNEGDRKKLNNSLSEYGPVYDFVDVNRKNYLHTPFAPEPWLIVTRVEVVVKPRTSRT